MDFFLHPRRRNICSDITNLRLCCIGVKLLRTNSGTAGVDLARTPETGLRLHGFTPVSENSGRAGSDSKRSEDTDIEAAGSC
jgi:hypothetical protein